MTLTNDPDLNTALTDLSTEDRQDECIKHALHVRSAWALSNYHRFFQLYLNAPKMAGYLMDKFVGRVRKSALKAAIKAYVSNLRIYFNVSINSLTMTLTFQILKQTDHTDLIIMKYFFFYCIVMNNVLEELVYNVFTFVSGEWFVFSEVVSSIMLSFIFFSSYSNTFYKIFLKIFCYIKFKVNKCFLPLLSK